MTLAFLSSRFRTGTTKRAFLFFWITLKGFQQPEIVSYPTLGLLIRKGFEGSPFLIRYFRSILET